MEFDEEDKPPEEPGSGRDGPGEAVESGSAPDCGGHALVEIPPNLPAKVLRADALARHGLMELARRQTRVEILPSFPIPISGHCVISDEANQRALLIGGHPSVGVCAFDFARRAWEKFSTGRLQPDAVQHPAVVLDTKRGRLIWFGGWPAGHDAPVDDLYVLNMNDSPRWEWRYIRHQHPWPRPRNGASLVLDAKRDRCILFGGDGGSLFHPLNDLWTLDLATLTWMKHKGALLGCWPSARWLHAAVSDVTDDRMIAFGGSGRLRWDSAFAVLDLASLKWKRVAPVGDSPPKMEGHAMIWVRELGAVFIYGGLLLQGAGPSSMPYLWRCDLSTLRVERVELPMDRRPPGRFCHAACYCRHRRALFCVGGRWNHDVAHYYKTDGVLADAFLIHLA